MAEPPALMHATQVARPFHTPGWVYEEKYDGWRILAVKEAGGVRLVSRNGRDHTKRFHAIAEALAKLKQTTFTLDGEVAVFDAELVSRFEWLRHINHGDLATPPLFMVFDLLQLEAKDYRAEPLKVRRKVLEKVVRGQKLVMADSAARRREWASGPSGSTLAPRPPGHSRLFGDPLPVSNRGFRWAELYFPPDRQVTQGVDSVMIDLSGEICGAITPITAVSSGTESWARNGGSVTRRAAASRVQRTTVTPDKQSCLRSRTAWPSAST